MCIRDRAYENMLAIATCNYPVGYRGCNGHSTLFDGVIYNTETGTPRDMLVCETGSEEGVFVAELDVDMLRRYRTREIGGFKTGDRNYTGLSVSIQTYYRKPEVYF